MKAIELKNLQVPLKEKYRDQPESAIITLKAQGKIGEGIFLKSRNRKGTPEQYVYYLNRQTEFF